MSKLRRILAVTMMIAVTAGFTACGGGGGNGGGADVSKVKGETYDTGVFSVLVPEGWQARDVLIGDEVDSKQLRLIKGTESEADMLLGPYMTITSYKDGTVSSAMDQVQYYGGDKEQLDPVEAGDYTWDAAQAGSDPYINIFMSASEPYKYEIMMLPKSGDKEVTLKDADVLAILGSLKDTGASSSN